MAFFLFIQHNQDIPTLHNIFDIFAVVGYAIKQQLWVMQGKIIK